MAGRPPRPRIPAPLPVEHGGPTVVHTELGVPISFDTRTAEFVASVRHVDGKGANMVLKSYTFENMLSKVRQRALVTPIRAFQLVVSPYAGVWECDPVSIREVEILEYHEKRASPFIVRLPGMRDDEVFALEAVYWPQPEDVAALEESILEEREEIKHHAAAMRAITAERAKIIGMLHAVTSRDIVHIQATGEQEVDAGLVTFLLEDDEEDDGDGAGPSSEQAAGVGG